MVEPEGTEMESVKLIVENMNLLVQMLDLGIKSNLSNLNDLKKTIQSAKSRLNKEQYTELMNIYKRYTNIVKSENKALVTSSKAFNALGIAFNEDGKLRHELTNILKKQELKN